MAKRKPSDRKPPRPFRTGEDVEYYRTRPGASGAAMRLVWGANDEDFGRILEAEAVEEIARRPHIFVKKYRRRKKKP